MNTLRFQYNMNLLQLVCHEEAANILNYLYLQLENDNSAKKQMVEHRDGHLGSQAIHLAAATGNHIIIEILIVHFNVDVHETTLSKQTVHHCASQRYDGIAAIFLFSRVYKIDVDFLDDKRATALHFATMGHFIKNV